MIPLSPWYPSSCLVQRPAATPNEIIPSKDEMSDIRKVEHRGAGRKENFRIFYQAAAKRLRLKVHWNGT